MGDGKIFSDHRQDGNVAIGGIGNLGRCGPSAVRYKETKPSCILRRCQSGMWSAGQENIRGASTSFCPPQQDRRLSVKYSGLHRKVEQFVFHLFLQTVKTR